MVRERDDVVGLDAALITHPRVWVASGHVATFHDPLADCKKCKMRWRVDHIEEGQYGEVKRNAAGEILCPNDGGELTEPRMFNLMFKTQVGTIADDENVAYLPPETAQGIFINFENVVNSMRRKLPFGIAQSRVSFRNEITPGNFIFRTLEFEQMEMEYFCFPPKDRDNPEEYLALHREWIDTRLSWYRDTLGIRRVSAPHPLPRKGRAFALQRGHSRCGVPLPMGLGRTRRRRCPHGFRPQGSRDRKRSPADVLR